MTLKSRILPVPLLFLAICASTVILISTARADSKTITFSEPVTVGGTVLKPGTYKVVWIGSEPDVQVSFMKGENTVATATARLALEKSPQRSITTKTMPDNSRALSRLSFKHLTLFFDGAGESYGTRQLTVG